jgi:hypothetical protein
MLKFAVRVIITYIALTVVNAIDDDFIIMDPIRRNSSERLKQWNMWELMRATNLYSCNAVM